MSSAGRRDTLFGMDTVELVMTIESEFDISIPDDVAATLGRLGDLHAHVVNALQSRNEPVDPAEACERIEAILYDLGV